MPEKFFSRTVTRPSTLTSTGGSEGYFTGFSRTGGFTRFRPGTASTRTGYYTQVYLNPRTGEPGQTSYTTTYIANFIGDFTRISIGAFTRTTVENYTGYYARNFTGNYARSFEGTYTISSAGVYARSFVRSYSRSYARSYARGYTGVYTRFSTQNFVANFTRDYVLAYTRSSTFTRTISGGSGEAPTYTQVGNDAEYGLVVYGPDGVTEVVNPTSRLINLAFYGLVSIPANGSTTLNITDAGDPTKVVIGMGTWSSSITWTAVGDTITIYNQLSYNRNITMTVARI